jgi:hypothetical protein
MSDRLNLTFNVFPRERYKRTKGLVLAIGGTMSGKTTWVHDFLDATKDEWWYCYVAATANDSNHELNGRFPLAAIHSEPNWETIELLHSIAKIRKNTRVRQIEFYDSQLAQGLISRPYYEQLVENVNKGQKILIYLEDAATDRDALSRNKVLNKLVSKGRHSDICIIISMQDLKAVGPKMRSQVKLVAACRVDSMETVDDLQKLFFSLLPLSVFRSAFTEITQNYQCMVADKGDDVRSCDMSQSYFVYKAIYPIRQTQVGSADFWTTNAFVYDDQWEDKEMDLESKMVLKALGGATSSSNTTKALMGLGGGGSHSNKPSINILDGYTLQSNQSQSQSQSQQQQQQDQNDSRKIQEWLQAVNQMAPSYNQPPLTWAEGVGYIQYAKAMTVSGQPFIGDPFQWRLQPQSQPQPTFQPYQPYQPQPSAFIQQPQSQQPDPAIVQWLEQYNQYAISIQQPTLSLQDAYQAQRLMYAR